MWLHILLMFSISFVRINSDENIIPVFHMDHHGVLADIKISTNPFHKMSSAQFADILYTSIKTGDTVIVFLEEKFATEDISGKDALGTPFGNLREAMLDGKAKYYPKVIEPYKLLTHLFQPQPFNVFHLGEGTDLNLQNFDRKLKHFYVYFRDEKNETRVETLRRHDLIMREVYTMVRGLVEGPVLAFYTGKFNYVRVEKTEFKPLPVVKFASKEAADTDGPMIETDGALFRFKGVYASLHTTRVTYKRAPGATDLEWTAETLTTKLEYTDFELRFNFRLGKVDWSVVSVVLYEGGEEVGRTTTTIRAPWYHSYFCGEPIEIINNRDNTFITIAQYQIQAWRKRRRRSLKKRAQMAKESPTEENSNEAIEKLKTMSSLPDEGRDTISFNSGKVV